MLYVREDAIVGPIDRFLHEQIGVRHLPGTLRRLADAQHRAAMTAQAADDHNARLRQTIADSDAKISRHRAPLDAGGDPDPPSTAPGPSSPMDALAASVAGRPGVSIQDAPLAQAQESG
jgi:hypothetical protein